MDLERSRRDNAVEKLARTFVAKWYVEGFGEVIFERTEVRTYRLIVTNLEGDVDHYTFGEHWLTKERQWEELWKSA